MKKRTAVENVGAVDPLQVAWSKNPLESLLSLIAMVCIVLACVEAIREPERYSSFALPVTIHGLLVLLGLLVSRRLAAARFVSSVVIVLALETIRGCVVPVLIQLLGQDSPEFRRLGSVEDATTILYVGNLFLAGVVTALLLIATAKAHNGRYSVPVNSGIGSSPWSGAAIFVSLGLVGLFIRFPTLARVQGFLAGSYEDLQTATGGGLLELASALLRPLLPVGIGLLLIRARARGKSTLVIWPVLMIAMFFSLGSYGLNRATIIFPVVAFVLAYATFFALKVRPVVIVTLGSAAALLFLLVGSVRNSLYAERIGGSAQSAGFLHEAVQTLLIYAQSPLQSAPVLSASRGVSPWNVSTLSNSFLSPIPGMSDELRANSGTAIYNYVIYGNSIARDQIVPSWLEAYLSLGALGPVLTGLLLAFGASALDKRRVSSLTFVGAYASTLAGLLLAQTSISSFSAVTQQLLYFVLVPLTFSALLQRLERARARAGKKSLNRQGAR